MTLDTAPAAPLLGRGPAPSDERGRVRLLVALTVLALVATTALLWRLGVGPFPDPEGCRARVGGVTVDLSTAQAENAALIAAVGVRRGLPARAVSIALATAFQESKLMNLEHGDRDSVGLFQQRPSQGWGTRAQVMDPYYATNAFYDALQKVDGYRDMRITEAAQEVQRSGFPEAYEEHAEGARALASALTGYSPARFSCVVREQDGPSRTPGASGLTPRAERMLADVRQAFGDVPVGSGAAAGAAGSARADGRAVDILVSPVSDENRRRGWAIAQYLVAQAHRLSVDRVIFDGRVWSSGRASEDGWRRYRPATAGNTDPSIRASLEHRDRVYVEVV